MGAGASASEMLNETRRHSGRGRNTYLGTVASTALHFKLPFWELETGVQPAGRGGRYRSTGPELRKPSDQ